MFLYQFIDKLLICVQSYEKSSAKQKKYKK